MVVSSSNEEAQRHVQMGMALIHGMWDFEAYRFFVEAAKQDPDCLLAYWGIVLSLADPHHEFRHQRAAAIERMFDLADAKAGTQLERGYVAALGFLFADGNVGASRAFQKLSEKYPNDLQVALLGAFLERDGYNEFGEPRYGQEEAGRKVKAIFDKNSESQMAQMFWVSLNTEAENKDEFLQNEVLEVARKLVASAPSYPPYQHTLGHLEWRVGNLALSVQAFENATRLYENYMKEQGVTVHDCPGWVRAKSYLAVAHFTKGDLEKSLSVADSLRAVSMGHNQVLSEVFMELGSQVDGFTGTDAAALEQSFERLLREKLPRIQELTDEAWGDYTRLIPNRVKMMRDELQAENLSGDEFKRLLKSEIRDNFRQIGRKQSAGHLAIVWEGKTLKSRFYLAREQEGDFQLAIDSLPTKDEVGPYMGHSLVIYFYEGLRQYVMARMAIEKRDFNQSQELLQALSHTYVEMNKQSDQATTSPEFSQWVRAKSALAVMIPELQGLSVMAGPPANRESAFNWYSSAVSKQQRPSLLMPPVIFYAMENRVAEFKENKGAHVAAGQEYVKSLKRFPNNVKTLESYEKILRQLGKESAADSIKNHVEAVRK